MKQLNEYDEKEFFAHFPKSIDKSIHDYAKNVAFLWSRYAFTFREGKQQLGYCTHCENEFPTTGLKHNTLTDCPHCSSECTVKASGRGRGRMLDEAYFVYYEKSCINPQAVIARGFYAVRDYTGDDYTKIETLIETKACYLFEPGRSVLLHRPVWYSSSDRVMRGEGYRWELGSSITSQADNSMANKRCYVSQDSIRQAVVGTPFQYSTWESYLDTGWDMVKFFDLYANYPCVEYLTKFGLDELVREKLNGQKTYSAINWRAKNPLKVLKLSKQQLYEIKNSNITLTPLMLRIMQISSKEGSPIPLHEIDILINIIGDQFYVLQMILKYTTIKKAGAYLRKQLAKNNKIFYRGYEVLNTWRDYVSDCKKLEMDLLEESVLFPSDLHRAHQNTIKQVKVQADEELSELISNRLKTLESFRFESEGYMLRPAANSKELIEEGKALHHCVGTYADRYAKGKTDIFVIRRIDQPEQPFYTLEIQKGYIMQCRGSRNLQPTKELEPFIEAFKQAKLVDKKNKSKKIKQEVAV